jgi:exosome complex RNA-binding protein Csl4
VSNIVADPVNPQGQVDIKDFKSPAEVTKDGALMLVVQDAQNTEISTVIANIQTGDQISATVLRLSTQHERD